MTALTEIRRRSARRHALRSAARALPAILLAGVAAAGAAAGAAVAISPHAVVERELLMMGTRLRLSVAAADEAAAARAAEAAVRALEATAGRLSTWGGDSELARLNRAPVGEPQRLSPLLAAELAAARRCSDATAGAFDPAVGPLVALWDLRGAGRVPAAEVVAAALPASRLAATLALDGDSAIRRHPAAAIDEGGFGKGAGLDHALRAAAAAGAADAWLDLGGQSASLGDAPWTVAIAHPDARQRPAVELDVSGGSVSTSGNGERRRVVAGIPVGHLLDPRTGSPAADFGSTTVWAADALTADCLSTGLFVLGPDAAHAWAAGHPEVGVLTLERVPGGLRARASGRLAGRVRGLDDGIQIFDGGEPAAVRR